MISKIIVGTLLIGVTAFLVYFIVSLNSVRCTSTGKKVFTDWTHYTLFIILLSMILLLTFVFIYI